MIGYVYLKRNKIAGPSGGHPHTGAFEPHHFATHRKNIRVEFSSKAFGKASPRLQLRLLFKNGTMEDQQVMLKENQQGLPGFEHRDGLCVTISEAARIYGVTEQSIRDWIKDRIIHEPINGQINLTKAIQSVYRHQRGIIEGRSGSSSKRFMDAKADLMELELAQKQNELISVKVVEQAAFDTARGVRNAMQNIAPRISAILAAETSEVQVRRILDKEIYDALLALSESNFKRKETDR